MASRIKIQQEVIRAGVEQRVVHVFAVSPFGIGSGIPSTTFTQKGGILAGLGAGTYAEVAPGTDGQVLKYDSAQAAGVIAGDVGDIYGTGVVGRVAQFVTNTKTLEAAKIIGPATNILTITNAAAATLALAITINKTLTLTTTGDYNLTVPATGTAAIGAGTLSATSANDVTGATHTHAITGAPALLGNGAKQYQTIVTGATPFAPVYSGFLLDGTTDGKTVFAVTATKTLTLTATDDYNLTIPATGTAALLGVDNNFTADTFWTGDGTGLPYGSCSSNDAALGWTQGGAVQNTWYDISDTDMVDGPLNLVTHDGSGLLTVTKAGHYFVCYTITAETSGANIHLESAISVSGTEVTRGIGHAEFATANVELEMAGTAILDLAASATINVSIRTTDAGTPNLAVEMVDINLVMLGGT